MENNNLITIVIPVYNTEAYIKRCVDTVLNQTYNNLEIILVDDGSTDSSPDICDEYARKYKNIIAYHKTNGGLSDARNYGINKSHGDYIFFLDSDDWIEYDAIKFLFDNLEKNNADISCGYFYISKDKHKIKQDNIISATYNREEALENLMYTNNFFTHTAWGKLYKISLFKDVKYPVGKLFEDLGTTYKLFSLSNKITVSNKIIYYYFKNLDGIMHQSYSSAEYDRILMADEELSFIKKHFPTIKNAAIFRLCYECCNILSHMPKNEREVKNIKNILRRYRKIVLIDKKVPLKRKVFILSSLLGQGGIKIMSLLKQ